MPLSAYEAERIEDALSALAGCAAQPLPEMVRRQWEEATALVRSHAQPRTGEARRATLDQAAAVHKPTGGALVPPVT